VTTTGTRPETHSSSSSSLPLDLEISVWPRHPQTALRFALSLLGVALVVAALATIVSIRQYRFVVTTFWIMLLVAYIALAHFLQYIVGRDVLPPVVRHVVNVSQREFQDFVHDWQSQVLLLTNHNDGNNHESDIPSAMAYDYTAFADGTSNPSEQQHSTDTRLPRPPRSRIFRVVVQPWLPLLSKRRRQQRQQRRRRGKNTTGDNGHTDRPVSS
jgi:hypothetical protein